MTNVERLYNCKDEELLPIGKFTVFSLKRDLTEFTAFSPKFNDEYVSETEAKISAVENLLAPQAETLAKSLISNRMNVSISGLLKPLNSLEVYLKLTAKSLGITVAGFGISALRTAVNARDPEAVVNKLRVVLANINTYKAALTEVGLSDELITGLETTLTAVETDRQQQYQILTKRKSLVQSNHTVLNDLYLRVTEIEALGKALYKGSDPVKLSEYTFTELLKKVRQVAKAKGDADNTDEKTDTN